MKVRCCEQRDLYSCCCMIKGPVAKFLVPDWGDIIDFWHRIVIPACQATYAGGPVRQPYATVDYIPQSGTKNLVSEDKCPQVENKRNVTTSRDKGREGRRGQVLK